MFQVRKKFRFEAAHVLDTAYSKECRKIHGHSYICEVFIQCETLDSTGMVYDFKKLKEITQPLINKLDHSLIVKDDSELKSLNTKLFVMAGSPTAESMAQLIYMYLKIRTNTLVSKVRVHETETGYAEYWEE